MSRSVTTAGVAALAMALTASTLALAQDGEPTTAVTNPNTGEISEMLVAQASSYDAYVEHIRALNACDWVGLMAQYPDDAEVHLDHGNVVRGREAIGELFAGFVLPVDEGGLCGITFTEESRLEVAGAQNVQWVAEADFLTEPYRGSDAYVSEGQYMDAMVSTFRGGDLMMVADESDSMEEEVADEMDVSEEEAAALDEMNDDEEAIAEEIMEDEE